MNAPIKNLMAAGTVSLIMAFVIMAALAQCASAATAIFQDGLDGYAGTEDNQILDPGTGFDDANVGGRNTFQLGNASPASTRRCLLRFDVSSLAGRFTSIDSATITLKKSNLPAGSGTDDAEMYAIADNNADWVEGTGQFVVQNGSSSWNSKQHPTAWIGGGGGGALGALQDTIANVSGNDAANTFYVFDLAPSLVDHWVTIANAGVVIKEGAEIDGAGSGTDLQIEFYAAEFGAIADAPVRPKLTVTYTIIPEPATLSLLGLASLLMVGCRRKR